MQTYKQFTDRQQCYADFTKGEFDQWLLAPCTLNRSSDELAESNWEVQLDRLSEVGTEGEDFTVLRASHWAVGWIDRLLVRPDSPCVAVCEDIEAKLEDYPVLDKNDFSEREWEAYQSYWDSGEASRQLLRFLLIKDKITPEDEVRLVAVNLQQWYQACVPSGDYYGEQCYPHLRMVAELVGAEEIKKLLALS